MAVYEKIVDGVNQQGRSNLEGQLDMFSAVPEVATRLRYEYPDVPEYSPRELLNFEKEVSGMYFSGHILDGYSKHISNIQHISVASVWGDEDERLDDGTRVTVCGIISDVTLKNTKNGDRMAFITVEDHSGEIECVIFPKVYEKISHLLRLDNCISLNGNIQSREEDVKILASGAVELFENAKYKEPEKAQKIDTPLSERTSRVKKLFLRIPRLDCEETRKAKNLIEIFEGNVSVMLYDNETKQYTNLGIRAEISNFLISELKNLLGDENVVLG